LADEIAGWRRTGVDVAVSMLTPDEAADLDLADEARSCHDRGIRFESMPTPDRGVPPLAAAAELAGRLAADLGAGKTVAVHCRQGIGRSAVLAAAVLVLLGVDVAAALAQIAAARGRPVPETPEQEQWVRAFAARTQEPTPR
jgi:protein-tyrosine phosphatase